VKKGGKKRKTYVFSVCGINIFVVMILLFGEQL